MVTDYRLNKGLGFDEIFDGRPDHFGVHDISIAEATPEFHC